MVCHQADAYRQHCNSKDGLDAELEAEHLECNKQQNTVDDEVAHLNRNACSPVEDRRHTGHAACSNVIRQ